MVPEVERAYVGTPGGEVANQTIYEKGFGLKGHDGVVAIYYIGRCIYPRDCLVGLLSMGCPDIHLGLFACSRLGIPHCPFKIRVFNRSSEKCVFVKRYS